MIFPRGVHGPSRVGLRVFFVPTYMARVGLGREFFLYQRTWPESGWVESFFCTNPKVRVGWIGNPTQPVNFHNPTQPSIFGLGSGCSKLRRDEKWRNNLPSGEVRRETQSGEV